MARKQDNKLTIFIKKPAEEVFAYSLASENVPKWITSIEQEIPSELPVRLGTKLKNKSKDSDNWNEYEVIDFQSPSTFTLKKLGGDYFVRYTCTPKGDGTEFEYYEWAENKLEDLMSMTALEKLKSLIEE